MLYVHIHSTGLTEQHLPSLNIHPRVAGAVID
jgi:hypothetical protein